MQLLLAKFEILMKSRKHIKSKHKACKKEWCFFSATTSIQKVLGILCYTKLAPDNYSLLIETKNLQFMKHSLYIIWYFQELVSADDFSPAEDFITQTVVKWFIIR